MYAPSDTKEGDHFNCYQRYLNECIPNQRHAWFGILQLVVIKSII